MGNAAVALSMMTVGMTVAQADLKSIFMDRCQLGFTAFSLLLVPLICIPFLHLLPIDPMSYGIFILLIAMPVGSTVTLIEMEYGGRRRAGVRRRHRSDIPGVPGDHPSYFLYRVR